MIGDERATFCIKSFANGSYELLSGILSILG